ncbi:transcription antitermination factor NusB [Canibacter sp. lx-72]|uniref:transcription antitermination factor NusB n=1 Tax=Canibacter zhuwentaonis TaxID=2837491 RepID=UPI001BDC4E56|nr:transcription antitermination factor NusB [Canibacter zhuwentaonis]MBT1017870.1 transcription antitermination factor NusB [Canibacter zhuwentaonis]MBT1035033.1 transcription antitermination factor NusB [Canibacter zhuwentaonis]
MSARSKARKRAMDMLYAADVLRQPLEQIRETEVARAIAEPERKASWLYANEIVRGIIAHAVEIDERIVSVSESWSIDRMPNVDRSVLRIAVWEMFYNDEVPTEVVIDEAINLAKEYSTAESGSFVHGILGKIADLKAL